MRSSIGRASWQRLLPPVVAALTVFSSSGFAASGSTRASGPTTAAASVAARRIRGATPRVVASGQAQLQAPVDPRQPLRLTLVLQPPHQDELQRFLRQALDPRSPRFHQFLTFDQWKARYAPTDAQVAAATAWARANGLASVHTFRNNLALKVEGTAGAVERTFGVQLNRYRVGNRRFFSNDRDPAIPQAMVGLVKDVQGLSNWELARPANGSPDIPGDQPVVRSGPFLREELSRRSAPGGGPARSRTGEFQPAICCGAGGASDIEAPDLFSSEAYDLASLQRFSHCCNVVGNPGGTPPQTSIAIIGSNKIATSDLTAFAAQYGMATHLTQVEINSPACCNTEMTLDIESATAFANSFGSYLDTAHIYAYEGGGNHLSDLLDAWQEAHSADSARVASTSFGAFEDHYGGIGDPSISDFSDVINAMAAEGWTMVAASGDHGATDDCQGRSVAFPASNPYVVAAGGTTLTLANNAGKPKFSSEVAWNGPGCGGTDWSSAKNLGGGGGGCADVEPAGWWQAIVPLPCSKRALPDISLNAGNGQMWYYAINGGWKATGGGTSIVAPELAGFFAQLNSYLMILGHACGATSDQACAPIGMPNAMIWLIGSAGRAANGHNPFYDITSGANGGQGDAGYSAGPGYDLATGWGSVNMLQLGWALIAFVSHGALPQVSFSGPATSTWYNTDRLVLFTVVSPNPTGTTASVELAGYTAQWDAPVEDVKSHATPGSGDSFYDGPQHTASSGETDELSLAAAGPGCHTAHVRVWDNAGWTSSDETYGPVCYDNQPPKIHCATPDEGWNATDATVNCAAFDQPGLSGLANPADASFQLSTSVPAGTETATAYTNVREVCDVAGNCAIVGPAGPLKVDKKAPAISISSPTATQYVVKQQVPASYACDDGGSGVATCAGPVTSGSPIDTGTVGTKAFTVNATDNVGNASSQTVTYAVTYRICLQYDATKPSNARGYVFTLQLCDNNGVNLSQMSIAVTATAVDGVAAWARPLGTLNPGNKFLYGPATAPGASYLYNLDTQGLANGSHVLNFTVQGDPIPHTAPFILKK